MKLKVRIIVTIIAFFLCALLFNLLRYLRHQRELIRFENQLQEEGQLNEVPGPVQPPVHHASWPSDEERNVYLKSELSRLQIDLRTASDTFKEWPWPVAASWVQKREIYPEKHGDLAHILFAMSTAKIIKADVLPKGTQLKLLFYLEGNQKVVFKQKRYERDFVIEGKPYEGFDRHNGEVAAFHLDRIFNFRRSPLTVGRIINLKDEVLPVATERLLKTVREKDGNICYYGVCYYCKESEMACAEGDIIEGSVTLWLPEEYSNFEKLRHPYQRTYQNGRTAKWQTDETYCEKTVKHVSPYDQGPRLLDITDATVFDYLIGNADRHHYEVFKDKGKDAMLLMMDNAKSFGNPHWHEPSILAPLRQCCILRNSTWLKLHYLRNGVLTELLQAVLDSDPISPVLHPLHYKAMDERLPHILKTVEDCIKLKGKDNVLINEWKGNRR